MTAKKESDVHIKTEGIPEALGAKAKELYNGLITELKKEGNSLTPERFMDVLDASLLKYTFGTNHTLLGLRSYDFDRRSRLIISDRSGMELEIEAQALSDIIKNVNARRFDETGERLKQDIDSWNIPEISKYIVYRDMTEQNTPNGITAEKTYGVTKDGRQFMIRQNEHFDENGAHAFWSQQVSETAHVIESSSLTLENEIGYSCIQNLDGDKKITYWITDNTKEIPSLSLDMKNNVWLVEGIEAFKNRFSGKIDDVMDRPSKAEMERNLCFLKLQNPEGFDQELKDRTMHTAENFDVQIPENSFIDFENAVKEKQAHFDKVKLTEDLPQEDEDSEIQTEKNTPQI